VSRRGFFGVAGTLARPSKADLSGIGFGVGDELGNDLGSQFLSCPTASVRQRRAETEILDRETEAATPRKLASALVDPLFAWPQEFIRLLPDYQKMKKSHFHSAGKTGSFSWQDRRIPTNQEIKPMLTKIAVAFAIILTTVSGSLAATKNQHSSHRAWDVYDTRGWYLGSDPDPTVRAMIARDHGY